MTTNASRRVRVEELERVANRIKRFSFVPLDGQPLPIFSAGSHVIVTMRDGNRIFRNPYSLMSSPLDTSTYQISVLRVDDTRGGSAFMHENVSKGMTLEINEPVNLFPVDRTGRKHILLAGGIGITPFMAMMAQFKHDKTNFELHYGVRSLEEGAYCNLLNANDAGVFLYRADLGQFIPLEQILENQPLGTHLYVCGPQGMIDWVLKTAKEQGWPKENVHYEHFAAPPPGRQADRRGLPVIVLGEPFLRHIEVAGDALVLSQLRRQRLKNAMHSPSLVEVGDELVHLDQISDT